MEEVTMLSMESRWVPTARGRCMMARLVQVVVVE